MRMYVCSVPDKPQPQGAMTPQRTPQGGWSAEKGRPRPSWVLPTPCQRKCVQFDPQGQLQSEPSSRALLYDAERAVFGVSGFGGKSIHSPIHSRTCTVRPRHRTHKIQQQYVVTHSHKVAYAATRANKQLHMEPPAHGWFDGMPARVGTQHTHVQILIMFEHGEMQARTGTRWHALACASALSIVSAQWHASANFGGKNCFSTEVKPKTKTKFVSKPKQSHNENQNQNEKTNSK